MAEEIEFGTVKIPVEMDFGPFDRQARADLKRRTQEAGRDMGEAAEKTSNWAEKLKALGQVAGGAALLGVNRLVDHTTGFLGLIGRGTTMVVDFTTVGLLAMARGLRVAAEESRQANGELTALGRAAEASATAIEGLSKILLTASGVLTGLKLAAAGATATLIVLSHRAAAQFAPGWNRVRTLLDDTNPAVRALRNEVSALAAEIGSDAAPATATFYEVLSAMPDLAGEPARALNILRTSLEAGATGFTDAAEAAAVLTASMNAFEIEAERAEEVSDKLFATQQLGVTTFGEIAGSIGEVGPLVSSLNGELDDLLGLVATLTPTGASTAQVMTQVRAAISNVLRPTADAKRAAQELGIEFNAAALEAQGLAGFLTGVIDATDGNTDLLARFFGSVEALQLLVALSGETETLASHIEQIGASAGLHARSVETMNDSWERQKELLGDELSGILRTIGFQFEGVGVVGLRAIRGITGAVGGLLDQLLNLDDRLAKVRHELEEQVQGDVGRRDDWLARWSRSGALPGVVGRGVNAVRLRLLGPSDSEVQEIVDTMAERVDRAVSAASRRESLFFLAVPGRPDPLPRPEEPTSIEYSRGRIQEMQRLREATAVADFARTGDLEAYQQAVQETAEAVNELVIAEMERLRAAGVEEGTLAQLASLYDVAAERARLLAEQTHELAERAGELEPRVEAVNTVMQGQRLPTFWTKDGPQVISGLTEVTREYERTLLDLREQLVRGAIDGEEAEARSAEAAERFNERLLRHIDHLRRIGKLTPELAAELVGALKMQGDTADETNNKLSEQAGLLEGLARGVLSVADAMGVLDDGTRRALQGVVDLASGIKEIATGNVIGGSVQALGGLIGLAQGVFGESEAEQRERVRQIDAMVRLRESLERLREAVLTDLSRTERERLVREGRTLAGRFVNPFTGQPFTGEGRLTDISADSLELIRAIEDATGIGIVSGDRINFDALREAVEALESADLGAFADTLTGQLDALGWVFAALGDDAGTAEDRLRRFLDVVRGFAPDFASQLEAVLASEGADAALAWAQSLAEAFAAEGLDSALIQSVFGDDLTAAEVRRIIEDGLDFLGGDGGGLVGGGTPETRLAVGITEVQANQLLAIESTQLYHLAGIHALLAGGAAPTPYVPSIAPPSQAEVAGMLGRAGGGGGPISISGIEVNLSFPAVRTVDPDSLAEAGHAAGAAMGAAAADQIRAAYRGRGGLGAPRYRADVGGIE